ncbi:hypothetical protein CLU79DRAFT_139556 [Phycomyces nitens]|nr:hypothetical protein CLU79DRAFT_139556 [Phycomyces nitens]
MVWIPLFGIDLTVGLYPSLISVICNNFDNVNGTDGTRGNKIHHSHHFHQQNQRGYQQREKGTANRSHVPLERCVHHNGLDNQRQTDDQTWLTQGPIQAQRHCKSLGERSTTSVLNGLSLARTILHSHWDPPDRVLL